MSTCSIEGCSRQHKGRGWCHTHYQRWVRRGDPEAPPARRRGTRREEHFLARIEPLVWSDCIVWTGPGNPDGYGRMLIDGRRVQAHRYAWEREGRDIPKGMEVDHTCWVRSCVNIEHLRLVTRVQNCTSRRGANSNSITGVRGVSPHGAGYLARVRSQGRVHSRCFAKGKLDEAAAWVAVKRQEVFNEHAGGN